MSHSFVFPLVSRNWMNHIGVNVRLLYIIPLYTSRSLRLQSVLLLHNDYSDAITDVTSGIDYGTFCFIVRVIVEILRKS